MKKKQQGWTEKEEKEMFDYVILPLDLEIQMASNLLNNLNVLNLMKPSIEISNARIHTSMVIDLLKQIKINN